ncbi:unnamed protein product, partial [Discosporangium mesarthrocarpum]
GGAKGQDGLAERLRAFEVNVLGSSDSSMELTGTFGTPTIPCRNSPVDLEQAVASHGGRGGSSDGVNNSGPLRVEVDDSPPGPTPRAPEPAAARTGGASLDTEFGGGVGRGAEQPLLQAAAKPSSSLAMRRSSTGSVFSSTSLLDVVEQVDELLEEEEE